MTKKSDTPMIKALRPYWRYEYARIALGAHGDPFKNLQRADEKKRMIVARGAFGCLLLNKFPYAPGHLLALPYRAVAGLEDLMDDEREELMDLVVTGKLLLQKVLKVDAVNIGLNQGDGKVSGGSVPTHLHWHIVPRWCGDNSFLPVIADTRILTRSQESVWKALCRALKKI